MNSTDLVVSISHSNYLTTIAGVEKVIRSEQQIFNAHGFFYIHLYPVKQDETSVVSDAIKFGVNVDGQPIGSYRTGQLIAFLRRFREAHGVRIAALHIHHLLTVPIAAVDSLIHELSPQEIRFFIHDYYALCRQTNLLYNGEVYCNIPAVDSLTCSTCLKGRLRKQHSAEMERLFAKVTQFVAPSEIAQGIFLRGYPELAQKIRVIPHQKLIVENLAHSVVCDRNKAMGKLRVAYVGEQYFHKGWSTWTKFIEHVDIDQYELYHLGNCLDEFPNVVYVPVSSVTAGTDAMLIMLKKFHIDVAFLWSICPETYSFTLFESIAAGCYVVTNPQSGNIAAQVRNNECGVVLDSEQELFDYFNDHKRVCEDIISYRSRENRIILVTETKLWDEDNRFVKGKNLKLSDTHALIEQLRGETALISPENPGGERPAGRGRLLAYRENMTRNIKKMFELLFPHQTQRRLLVKIAITVLINPWQVLQSLYRLYK